MSDVVSLIPDFSTDGWVVVKPHRKGKCLDTDSGSEGSDCENGLEQASEPVQDERVDRKKGSEPESLPVLTAGSFIRYAQHTAVAEQDPLTWPIAGNLCSSICARARSISHPSNLKE